MNVEMLNSTPNPLTTIYLSVKVCTTDDKTFNLLLDNRETHDKMKRVVQTCLESGHESVLEHVSATFLVQGISRACSHQLVRHRLASYSQQSQRYVDMTTNNCTITPPSFFGEKASFVIENMNKNEHLRHIEYPDLLQAGVPKEDARYILPESTSTSLIMTANARELLHFFGLRCCTRAQWEIRKLANNMLDLCEEWFPEIFDGSGAKCERLGYCTEKDSCGKYPTLQYLMECKEKIEESISFHTEDY